jgi:hypothetical protein
MVHAQSPVFAAKRGTGAARPWPSRGILPAAMGRRRGRNPEFCQRPDGLAWKKYALARRARAVCFSRHNAAWSKILNRNHQLASVPPAVYIAGATCKLPDRPAIE